MTSPQIDTVYVEQIVEVPVDRIIEQERIVVQRDTIFLPADTIFAAPYAAYPEFLPQAAPTTDRLKTGGMTARQQKDVLDVVVEVY